MFDITPILKVVIALAALIFTVCIIPYIRSKMSHSELDKLRAWIEIAVQAAEQIFKGTGLGEQKKQYVLSWLNSMGVTVATDELDAMIEAAVYRLNTGKATITTEILVFVRAAVQAAEQLFPGSGRGEEKKKAVIEWLSDHGVKLDTELLDILVESAVYELNNSDLLIGEPVLSTTETTTE